MSFAENRSAVFRKERGYAQNRLMRELELFKFWMPPKPWEPKAKPYLSRWHMSQEDAAKVGALEPDLTTRRVIQIDEKPDINGSFSHLGTSWRAPSR